MKMHSRRPTAMALLLAAAALCTAPAWAEKPDWAGGPHGKHGKHGKHERGDKDERGESVAVGHYFGEQHRVAVRGYYEGTHHGGKACPPGLAKKHNGCLPPGQEHKWAVGQPLPPDVVYYPVPTAVVAQIGPPPAGYRYVRVAADILLIGTGSRMVIDGMQDLVR